MGPGGGSVCQVSLNLRRGRFFDISELPLSSSLLISKGLFYLLVTPSRETTHSPVLRGEGVRARGHMPSQDLFTLTPKGSTARVTSCLGCSWRETLRHSVQTSFSCW